MQTLLRGFRKINVLLLLFVFASTLSSQTQLPPKKILFVATNVNQMGGAENGTYLVEIVFPFKFFSDKGYDVDIVTPNGGKVALYDMGNSTERMMLLKNQELFVTKTNASLKPMQVKVDDYCAVYIPGGYGQFFDVAQNDSILQLIAMIYEKGGVLGVAGHGGATLCQVKLSNGHYLVEGKQLTCFPWQFEISKMAVSNYGKNLPYNFQQVLKQHGAIVTVCEPPDFSSAACRKVNDLPNRLVTGAFADDCLWVAEEMCRNFK